MKQLNYGKNYKYPHDYPGHLVEENYLPDNLIGKKYYQPDGQGYEVEIMKRMEQWQKKTSLNSPPKEK